MSRPALIALVALVVVVLVIQAVGGGQAPASGARQKIIQVRVVHGDGGIRDFELYTGEDYLGSALVEGGVIEDNQDAGASIFTVDGETADANAQEWWRLTSDEEPLDTVAGETPLSDGDRYELTLMTAVP